MNIAERIDDLVKRGEQKELMQLAVSQGLSPHHRCAPETIAKMIMDNMVNPVPTVKHQEETSKIIDVKKEPKLNTEDEIRIACKKYFDKQGFVAEFTDETWHFKCRGAEDSGHLTVPLRVIVMKAEMVSYGRRSPMGLTDFDSLANATGKNAYTNTVLNA